MIMINSQHTLRLLEKCLAMKEDRLLRCGNNEPWGYSIMCAAYGLLEAHLGLKTTQEAKAVSAQRFIDLHYKMLGQSPPAHGQPLNGVAGQVRMGAAGVNGAAIPSGAATPGTPVPISGLLVQTMPPINGISAEGPPPPNPTTPWLFAGGDPATSGAVGTLGTMPEVNLEILGLNLSDLWGDEWNLT